jgi:hypothetical protein
MNFLINKKEHSENFPDDPLIDYGEFVNNGIQANQLEEIKGENVTFSCADGLSYTTWLPQPYLDDFRKAKAFPINRNGNLTAKSITVWKGKYSTGIAIAGNNRWFNINPEVVWGGIWGYVWKNALPDGLMLKGEDAYRFWSANFNLYQTFEAASFSLGIERNPNLLPYIKKFKPYLLDHPAIQIELAKAYKRDFIQELPTKKGRPQELTKEILEMYFWVYFYRYQGLTLNEACLQTISQHSGLVPNDWRDTDATLKKTVTRLDKLTSISQKKGFTEFKKMKKDKM